MARLDVLTHPKYTQLACGFSYGHFSIHVPICAVLFGLHFSTFWGRMLVLFDSHFSTFTDRILVILDPESNVWGSQIAFYYHPLKPPN